MFNSKSRHPYFGNSVPLHTKTDNLIEDFTHFEAICPKTKIYIDYNYSSPYDSFSVYRFSES